jgi:DNA modification methylase
MDSMIPESVRKYVYYEEPDIVLLHGDCLEILPLFEPKSFDLVLTDPPYGIGEDGGKARTRGQKYANHEKMNWDKSTPNIEVFDEMFRISNNQMIFGGNYFTDKGLKPSMGWIYWDKRMGGDFSDGELIYTSFDKALKSITIPQNSVNRQHPTQKPVELIKWCVEFALDAKAILDPFLGSGTTVVACKQLGRKCVGIELEKKYLDVAIERLRQEQLF